METQCHICAVPMLDSEIVSHLEQYHIGKRHYEWVHLSCGECTLTYPFSEHSIRFMMRHFSTSGHSMGSFAADWTKFVDQENIRLTNLIRLGTEYEQLKLKPTIPIRNPKVEMYSAWNDLGKTNPRKIPISSVPNPPIFNRKSFTPLNVFNNSQKPLKRKIESTLTLNPEVRSSEDEDIIFDDKNRQKQLQNKIENAITEDDSDDMGIVKCSLCDYTVHHGHKTKILLHVLKHDKSLAPFKCSACDVRSSQKGNVQAHMERRNCGGSVENVQTAEMIEMTRELLREAFPQGIDWDTAMPPGKSLVGIKL